MAFGNTLCGGVCFLFGRKKNFFEGFGGLREIGEGGFVGFIEEKRKGELREIGEEKKKRVEIRRGGGVCGIYWRETKRGRGRRSDSSSRERDGWINPREEGGLSV